MFFFRSEPPERPALDTTTPCESQSAAERTARHLAMCQELADLGMQLTRAAAAKALRDAEAASAAAPPAATPRARSPDPTLAFARLSREVRQIITLECHLAAGPAAAASVPRRHAAQRREHEPRPGIPKIPKVPEAPRAKPANADNRRALIRQVVNDLTEQHPNRDIVRMQFTARADRALAADPGYEIPASRILLDIASKMGLDLETAEVSQEIYDELLPHRFRTQEPEQPAFTTPAFTPPITPRSTSPPGMVA